MYYSYSNLILCIFVFMLHVVMHVVYLTCSTCSFSSIYLDFIEEESKLQESQISCLRPHKEEMQSQNFDSNREFPELIFYQEHREMSKKVHQTLRK